MKVTKDIVQDDQQLVLLAQRNRKAFALIYEKYFERIYLFIYKRVQDEALAGDLCQETMLKAMFNIAKYENRGAPFSAWLYRIASNEVNLHFRKAKKVIEVEVQERDLVSLMTEIKLTNTADLTEQERLVGELSKLEPEQAEIIDLRFFMQYSFKEIAEFYNITEANAKMRLYRVLDRIKKGWGKK